MRLNQFLNAKDDLGLDHLAAVGLVSWVTRGTAARVIALDQELAEVRIESGAERGQLVWVDRRFLDR